MRIGLALAALVLVSPSALAQSTHNVTQSGLVFPPDDTPLRVGDTVVWTWTGFGDHTITEGDDGIASGDEAFNEALGPSTPSVSITFDAALFDQLSVDPGLVVDYFCLPHFAFGMTGTLTFEPWIDRGNSLPGGGGPPALDGTGTMVSGTGNSLEFSNMLPASTVFLFVGISELNAPFKGGVLGPAPLIPPIGLPTLGGSLSLPFTQPAGLPFGLSLYFQGWVDDVSGPKGLTATNTLEARLP